MDFRNGELITTGVVSTDTELKAVSPYKGAAQLISAYIEVKNVAGTGVRFASGESAANNHLFQSGDKIIISFSRDQPLHFFSDNAADTFVITY